MIKSRKDLKFYLKEDGRRNGFNGYWKYILYLFASHEKACTYRYIRCLRKCEYHLNNSKGSLWHKLWYNYYNLKKIRLGMKYHIKISPNVCGYGLRIMHISGGGGVRIGAKKCGNYCGFNSGVLIGTVDGSGNRPIIGDYVAFGPGAKAFGNLTIGSNVFVAPNAVVTKDIPANSIIGGIPAKILKERKLEDNKVYAQYHKE